ncbi:hypothetical protein ERJ75_000697600 [Trypanosoma vivax]|nr:hypothetical protein ERJ75_000697600 [Trypanosoma vivax]
MKTRRASAGDQLRDDASELDMGTRGKSLGRDNRRKRAQAIDTRHEETGQRGNAVRPGIRRQGHKGGGRAQSDAQDKTRQARRGGMVLTKRALHLQAKECAARGHLSVRRVWVESGAGKGRGKESGDEDKEHVDRVRRTLGRGKGKNRTRRRDITDVLASKVRETHVVLLTLVEAAAGNGSCVRGCVR